MGNIGKGIMGGGLGFLSGGWGGAAAGLLGGLGGGGKSKSPNMSGYGTKDQAALLQYILPLLKDPGIAVAQFGKNAYENASMQGERTGSMIGSQTGNPYAEAALKLGYQNRATEGVNDFAQNAYSPAGRAAAAQGVLGLMQGINQQHLQKYQINQDNQRPTFAENVLDPLIQGLPWYLQNRSKQPQQPAGGPGFGLGMPMGNGVWNPGNNVGRDWRIQNFGGGR